MTARANEWKYVPVRRLGVYDEQCLEGGTHWAMFEPNADPLRTAMTGFLPRARSRRPPRSTTLKGPMIGSVDSHPPGTITFLFTDLDQA